MLPSKGPLFCLGRCSSTLTWATSDENLGMNLKLYATQMSHVFVLVNLNNIILWIKATEILEYQPGKQVNKIPFIPPNLRKTM